MWRLDGTAGRCEHQPFSAALDVAAPQLGVWELSENDRTISPGPLLSFFVDQNLERPKLAEAYVRGDDLVATYQEQISSQVRPQLYWRAVTSTVQRVRWGLELILSVQTNVLDSRPKVQTVSQLLASDVFLLGADGEIQFSAARPPANSFSCRFESVPCAVLMRIRESNFSYLELLHPTDFVAVDCWATAEDPRIQVRQHFATDRLEKGVIRRCRIRSLLLDRQGDLATAQAAYQDFANSPPPLTT